MNIFLTTIMSVITTFNIHPIIVKVSEYIRIISIIIQMCTLTKEIDKNCKNNTWNYITRVSC